MNDSFIIKIIAVLVYIPLIPIFFFIPNETLAKEFFGYFAYAFPVIATITAGDAILNKNQTKSDQIATERSILFQSLTYYFCGIGCYILYTIWPQIGEKSYAIEIVWFILALIMLTTSVVMHMKLKQDKLHPFFRSLLSASFLLGSVLILIARAVR